MASTKRIEQKAATRAKVLAAAQELFTARGFEAVSIRDVAAKAGVSSGAIFSSVDGKDALFEAAMGRKPPLGRVRAWLREFAAGNENLPPRETAAQLLADLCGANHAR